MKKIKEKKEYIIIIISIILFIGVSVLSFTSIKQLQGNARVVNFDGIVRGATQKLMKEEIMDAYNKDGDTDYTDDKLIARLDSIINELKTGKPIPGAEDNKLIVLQDSAHKALIEEVSLSWASLKDELYNVRGGADPHSLFEMSQDYFVLVNDTVFAAEAFSEKQVTRTTSMIIIVNVVIILFILFAIFMIYRGQVSQRKADALGLIAYVDVLTKMNNRASCERKIDSLKDAPSSKDLAVLMFDMNNLKLTNDFLGHQGGDILITKFAHILMESAAKFGFIGRYGGDEFLAIFEDSNLNDVKGFLDLVRTGTRAYNSVKVNDIEKISFSVGHIIANQKDTSIDEMIYEADRQMYANKRKMKTNGALW
ncbi:MAG: GGDEF domain-containing protein [Clostridiales Family XIII bacterium]|jgi:diguanylate cyclase (GGDEF)-like protein|nr:GGDEF domain-containing protein [Clostridiales Family XIII bacterium]